MALEVKELVVKFTVNETGRLNNNNPINHAEISKFKREVIEQSVNKILDILEKKNNR